MCSYLTLLFICLILHQVRLHHWVPYMFASFVIVSLGCLASCYLYQFNDVQEWMGEILSHGALLDLGLVDNPPPALFTYLLQVCSEPRASDASPACLPARDPNG